MLLNIPPTPSGCSFLESQTLDGISLRCPRESINMRGRGAKSESHVRSTLQSRTSLVDQNALRSKLYILSSFNKTVVCVAMEVTVRGCPMCINKPLFGWKMQCYLLLKKNDNPGSCMDGYDQHVRPKNNRNINYLQ